MFQDSVLIPSFRAKNPTGLPDPRRWGNRLYCNAGKNLTYDTTQPATAKISLPLQMLTSLKLRGKDTHMTLPVPLPCNFTSDMPL